MAPIHTSPADAIMVHKILQSPKSIGMHFGTFPLADDGMEDPVKDLRIAWNSEGIEEKGFIVPEEGRRLTFSSDN